MVALLAGPFGGLILIALILGGALVLAYIVIVFGGDDRRFKNPAAPQMGRKDD